MISDDHIAEGVQRTREEILGFSGSQAIPYGRWLSQLPAEVGIDEAYKLIEMAHELLAATHEQLLSASRILRSDMPDYYAVAPLESAAVRAVEAMACVWHITAVNGDPGCPKRPGAVLQRKVEQMDLDNLMFTDMGHKLGSDSLPDDFDDLVESANAAAASMGFGDGIESVPEGDK